ncbi:MAG: hypothetical protein J7L34_03125 [Thermotogaceae bacterium]|nr:hypothetical protein [Thermotogaceae bacterium]
MNRRTTILLTIAVLIWIVALGYYLLINGKFSFNLSFFEKSEATSTQVAHSKASVRITPEFLESYKNLVHKEIKVQNMFKPYYTEKVKEFMRDLIINSPDVITSIGFEGYIITPEGGRVFLKIGNLTKSYSLNNLILDRHIIVYASSIGVVVLDVKEGGLKVIK